MRWYRRTVGYVAPDEDRFETVRDRLGDLGLEVEHVHTVEHAEQLAEDGTVDCLIVDDGGDLDAVAVLDAVARSDELLPVVLYPVDGSERLAARAVQYDCVDAYVLREEGFEALQDALAAVFRDLRDPRRDAEGMLDTVMEMIPDTVEVYFKDARGRHVHLSDEFPGMIGPPYIVTPDEKVVHTSEDVHGMTDFDLYGHELGTQTRSDEQRIMETGEPVVDKLEEGKDYQGRPIFVSSTKAPWYDSAGNLRGIVGVTLDVTDRERKRRAIERQNQRLDRFAGVLSHDLRNPLSVAQGRVDDLTGAPEAVEDVEWALDRIEELVTDVLALARQGAIVDDPEPVDLAVPVREAWSTIDGEGTLDVETLPTVHGDPERLRALFENLLRNAVTHGGSDVQIRIAAREDGFVVADDGPGIPEERRDRVFEHGFSTADDGTGFGLAIVEEIVEAHGWAVEIVESDDGGSAFVVDFEPES